MQNDLTLLHRHILMKRQISLILPKMQLHARVLDKICTVPILDWHLQKTWKDVLHS